MATPRYVKQPTKARRQYLFGFDYRNNALCCYCQAAFTTRCTHCQDEGWWTIEDFYDPTAWYKKT